MSRRAGGKTIELSPEDNAEFEALCKERDLKRGQLAHILLSYAMPRATEAIKEWIERGERRSRQRRNKPIPLRVARIEDEKS